LNHQPAGFAPIPALAVVVSQETSDFCGKDGIAAEIETIPINQVKDAFERVTCSDVRFRFVSDMATL
jgi:uncharacterized zinc-type alcohol dehydrogenase-like protein